MSGLIVGLVLRTPVTKEFNGEAKFVALIYAEHAWEDGTHAYPAISSVAAFIGCSERSVQRHVRVLERMGMMIPDGKGPHGTNRYRFPVVGAPDGSVKLDMQPVIGSEKPEKVLVEEPENGGDNLSPRQIVTGGGDTDSGDTDSGDTGVTRINNPLLRSYEEEEKNSTKNLISENLEKALTDAGIFRSVWKSVADRICEDWSENDILAVLAWMRATRQDPNRAAQGFATRIRERSKAPQKFYPLTAQPPTEHEDPDELEEVTVEFNPVLDATPDGSHVTIRQAWDAALAQLSTSMPKSAFENYAASSQVVDFANDTLIVRADDPSSREWLDNRIRSSARRMLTGILAREIDVEFIAEER